MPPLTGLGFLLGLAFYNDVAPLALGRGFYWDWRSKMMSRRWRWGGRTAERVGAFRRLIQLFQS